LDLTTDYPRYTRIFSRVAPGSRAVASESDSLPSKLAGSPVSESPICSVLALSLIDLAYNKLEANRSKDEEFLKNAINEGLIQIEDLGKFIIKNAPSVETRERLFKNLKRIEGL
jgi:hypothetical protein